MNIPKIIVGVLLTGVLLAIFVPKLLRAAVAANEAEAIADTRTVMSAEQAFASANCGFFDDVTNLCRNGPDCRGITIPGYVGPEFLSSELGRKSPYAKAGYERTWIPGLAAPRPSDCTPSPTATLDYCYISTPRVVGLSGARAFGGNHTGSIILEPSGAPLPCPLPPGCVVEGTLIQTPSGAVPIESLAVGDDVIGLDSDRVPRVSTVAAIRRTIVESHLRLTFSSGRVLEATDIHPVSTPEGWRSAGTLTPGDVVHARDGLDTVERADPVAKHGGVYDLTVEPDACFFASEILVHNKSFE